MNWIEEVRNIKSGKKELRSFGFTVGGVFALLGIILLWRGKETGWVFIVGGSPLLALGALKPSLLKPLQKAWMTLAMAMGWVMTRVILTVVFYLVLTPIGLLVKLSGKDLLDLKFELSSSSYWRRREKGAQQTDCEKQF